MIDGPAREIDIPVAVQADSQSLIERLCRLIESVEGDGEPGLHDEIGALLRGACGLLAVKHMSFCVLIDPRGWTVSDRVYTTYSREWIGRYLEKKYWTVDPLLAAFYRDEEIAVWGPPDHGRPGAPILMLFLRDSAAHGVGTCGYARFLRLGDHGSYVLSVSADEDAESLRRRMGAAERELDFLGRYIQERTTAPRQLARARLASLTDEEILVLRLLASGARPDEVMSLARLAVGADRIMEAVMRKLEARSLSQAVVRFIEIRDREFLPPTGVEIKSFGG